MKSRLARKLLHLRPVCIAASLALAACGGGNGVGSSTDALASEDGMKGALSVGGQVFNPVPCADQGGSCTIAGEQNVAYGGNGKYIVKRFKWQAPCDDSAFGDSTTGKLKRCFLAAAVVVPITANSTSASTDDMKHVVLTPATFTGVSNSAPAPAPAPAVALALVPAITPPPPAPAPAPVVAAPAAPSPAVAAAPAPMVAALRAPAPAAAPAPAPAPAPSTALHGGIKVDSTNLPVGPAGIATTLLSAADLSTLPAAPQPGDWESGGAFRTVCNFAKMSFDDPIAYPGQPGVAHLHTFFGNTAIDAFTTPENIRSKSNASCRGGTINLSGYWVPSMINTATGKPIVPTEIIVYYKTVMWPYMNDGSIIQALPKGLRMIAGDANKAGPGNPGGFVCNIIAKGQSRPGAIDNGESIPTHCVPGQDELRMVIDFPQCWDGVNLDSPDHKSHMSGVEAHWTGNPERQYRCPLTHPVVLPGIKFSIVYAVPADPSELKKWRLSSDTYDSTLPGGYSLHADWMNGWDPVISDLWGTKCLRERRDCGSANVGDGRTTLEFQGN